MHVRIALGILAAAAVCTSASGQNSWVNSYTGRSWNNAGSALIDTLIWNNQLAKAAQKQVAKTRKSGPASPAPRITYVRSQTTVAKTLAASLGSNEKLRGELETFFTESLASFEEFSAREGRKHDLGFCFAFMAITAIGMCQDADIQPKQLRGLARQFDQVLAALPKIKNASSKVKQQLADTMVCLVFFELAGYKQGLEKKDGELTETFKTLAENSVTMFLGLKVGRLKLDPDGTMTVSG